MGDENEKKEEMVVREVEGNYERWRVHSYEKSALSKQSMSHWIFHFSDLFPPFTSLLF